MFTTDIAKVIRKALKANYGITSRQVNVRAPNVYAVINLGMAK